jgi:hypothetical protein
VTTTRVHSIRKPYNADAPVGGIMTITSWGIATKTVTATFSLNAAGEDFGTSSPGSGSTPGGVPTEKPSVTGGELWVVYQ